MVSEEQRRGEAKAALGKVSSRDLAESMKMIRRYAAPYRNFFKRPEQGEHLGQMIAGLSSNLERKSVEPIAVMHGIHRRTLEHFIGGNRWDWNPLMDHMRSEVKKEIGIDEGSLIIDGSAVPKKGDATVGVARQWCGRLGKQDNCVVGVYAAYVGKDDLATLVDANLFLPQKWADDMERRAEVYVPPDVTYRTQPEIAVDIVRKMALTMPFSWVLADDEFGRTRAFRDTVRECSKSYILDVPKDTVVRRVRKNTTDTLERKKWQIQDLRCVIPVASWGYFHVRDGEKNPIEVRATMLPVATERDNRTCVIEMLIIIETLDGSERWYCLAHAPEGTPLSEFVRRAGLRHRVEETFEEAKGEVGLDHFETRTWQGWNHHMTLCFIALWFLLREKRRLGKKSPGSHDQYDSRRYRTTVLSGYPRAFC